MQKYQLKIAGRGFSRSTCLPDPTDTNTASSQRRAPLGKGATLSVASQATDISRYWRQNLAEIACWPWETVDV